MYKKPVFSVLCAALLLTACDHYSNKLASMEPPAGNVHDISPAAGDAMTFSQYLANEYYHLARTEQSQNYDYKAAKLYTEKMEQLTYGRLVAPSSVEDFDIKGEERAEAAQARIQLIDALKTYNIPENRAILARAQSRYDCWLDQLEDTQDAAKPLPCKAEFQQAMASLLPPDGMEMRFTVPFPTGSMSLNEEARSSIGRVLSFWRLNKEQGGKIILRPATGIPLEESERQIAMVKSILQFNGIPATAIDTELTGETEVFEILYERPEPPVEMPPQI
jgi:hypothetical protein